jgi:hypothetical protein
MHRTPSPQLLQSTTLPSHLRKNTYVRVTKLHATVDGIPACPKQIYEPGLWPGLSLPINYWMEGILLADVLKNGHIRLDRRVRDSLPADGVFVSTRVCSVLNDKVRTFNSIYLIEAVEPFIPGLRS